MGLKKVWFITGASKGLGLSLVNQLLQAGQSVAATSRTASELSRAVNTNSEKFLPLEVNLADEKKLLSKLLMQQSRNSGELM